MMPSMTPVTPAPQANAGCIGAVQTGQAAYTDYTKQTPGACRLLTPAEEGTGFARNYFEALQRDPAVVLGHRDMMNIFNGLLAT